MRGEDPINIEIREEIARLDALGLLERLLVDQTTGAHILWATDAYAHLGEGYQKERGIEAALITGEHAGVITNRAGKALSQQSERTRRHAEVFTPLWICAKMNDYADEMWFGRPDAFFVNGEPTKKVVFRKDEDWKAYVDSPRLELTCGEAPFLVSRYDAASGSAIPIERRVGILDRKLRVVSEHTRKENTWLSWARRAYQSTYGYEFQGDNLLIARLNLLMSFEEHFRARWKSEPPREETEAISEIIAWNLWQMDGLTGTIPYSEPLDQLSIKDLKPKKSNKKGEQENRRCIISNWHVIKKKRKILFLDLPMGGKYAMKFEILQAALIQNPIGVQGSKTLEIRHFSREA